MAGSHGEKASAKAELVNLRRGPESLCRAASGQLDGARQGQRPGVGGHETVSSQDHKSPARVFYF